MRPCQNRRGATLLEILAVVALTAGILFYAVRFLSTNTSFFRRTGVRTQVLSDARNCMDVIIQRLRNAKARTLVVSTPYSAQAVPNSRVDFVLATKLPSGATSCAIYLSSGTIYLQELTSGVPLATRPVASNVAGLVFTGDSRDPSILNVSLRIEAPWDASNDPTHVSTVILPNQVVHLSEAP